MNGQRGRKPALMQPLSRVVDALQNHGVVAIPEPKNNGHHDSHVRAEGVKQRLERQFALHPSQDNNAAAQCHNSKRLECREFKRETEDRWQYEHQDKTYDDDRVPHKKRAAGVEMRIRQVV